MTATDSQVKIAMREIERGHTQEQAAARANVQSRQTVAKYAQSGRLPSALKQPRTYRTRPDPFAEDWAEIEGHLERAPELEAGILFTWLCEQHPDRYQEGQLRTLQRRISVWRAVHGSQLLSLPQVRHPGEALQTDGTSLSSFGITIASQPFPHVLIHSVLPYSNWEWGRVAQSESLLAIQLGLCSAIEHLGYVPKVHQTDNSTAATHRLGPHDREQTAGQRGYNEAYLTLLHALGMEPRTTHLESPNENGDIEAANGSFQHALEQHLLFRGHRDFASEAAYESFLFAIMDKRNALRRKPLAEELAVMRPWTGQLPPAVREEQVSVSAGGTIRVLHNTYSVPSGLAGRRVTARIGEWQIEVWYANQCVATLARLTGARGHHINYRHVIDSLLRKPGGFRDYRYRDDLFPTLVFRQAWEALDQRLSPRKADLAYLRILKLAALDLETDVAGVLRELLASTAPWDDTTVAARLRPLALSAVPSLSRDTVGAVDLSAYDALLAEAFVATERVS